MKHLPHVLIILFLVSFTACKAADVNNDNENNDTNNDNDTNSGDDDDDNDDLDTDKKVHYGCVEKKGEHCLDIDDQTACSAEEYCQWGVDQCLPNGFGCRDEKTKDGCENLGFCTFKTWDDNEPCIYLCDIHWDEDSCNEADGCEWTGRHCRPTKMSECREQSDKESCDKIEDCAFNDSCTIKGFCAMINDEATCSGEKGCTWKDGDCLFECQLLYTTEEECNASGDDDDDTESDSNQEDEIACEWNPRQMLCITDLPMQNMRTCRPLSGDECKEKEECLPIQECSIDPMCNRLDEAECIQNDKYCTAGLCEHVCTPKNSPQGCEANEECMWIEVYYEAGQTCVTACH